MIIFSHNLSEQVTPSRKRKIDEVDQSNERERIQRSTARSTPRNTPPRSTAAAVANESSDDDIICLDTDSD